MKVLIDIPEILLDRIKSAKCVPDMYGSDIVNTAVCVRDATPYKERPHGEWVESKERKGHFYCSECVQQDESGKWRELFDYKYNFCPNCGADMREGGENG